MVVLISAALRIRIHVASLMKDLSIHRFHGGQRMLNPMESDLMTAVGMHLSTSILLSVIPVLDLVIASTAQGARYLGPFRSLLSMKAFDSHAFFCGDRPAVDGWL